MENQILETMHQATADCIRYEDEAETVIDGVCLHFDEQEAKGNVVVERSGYGAYIWVNGQLLCMIDLYHLSPESPDGYPQIAIYHPGEDDTLAHVQFLTDCTDVVYDRTLSQLEIERDGLCTTISYQSEQDNE